MCCFFFGTRTSECSGEAHVSVHLILHSMQYSSLFYVHMFWGFLFVRLATSYHRWPERACYLTATLLLECRLSQSLIENCCLFQILQSLLFVSLEVEGSIFWTCHKKGQTASKSHCNKQRLVLQISIFGVCITPVRSYVFKESTGFSQLLETTILLPTP